jgi:hypothetical protein
LWSLRIAQIQLDKENIMERLFVRMDVLTSESKELVLLCVSVKLGIFTSARLQAGRSQIRDPMR